MMLLWDEPKRRSNLLKHGLDFAGLDDAFFLRSRVVEERSGRYAVVGEHRGKWIVVVLKPMGREAISIISMRRANRKERMNL